MLGRTSFLSPHRISFQSKLNENVLHPHTRTLIFHYTNSAQLSRRETRRQRVCTHNNDITIEWGELGKKGDQRRCWRRKNHPWDVVGKRGTWTRGWDVRWDSDHRSSEDQFLDFHYFDCLGGSWWIMSRRRLWILKICWVVICGSMYSGVAMSNELWTVFYRVLSVELIWFLKLSIVK